jgi:hypothetical protein
MQPTTSIETEDDFIRIPLVSAELLVLTGNPGPGHRALVQGANDGRLPMLERRGRFLGCQRLRLPKLAAALGLRVKTATPLPPHREADTPRRAA